MKIATWNVNGIRARAGQLRDWLAEERPDVLCLQEIKASADQVPELLMSLDDYWSYWHGVGGYSGVSLHVLRARWTDQPAFVHPTFDFEQRIVTVDLQVAGEICTIASVYVPNGGKDFPAKMRFLAELEAFTAHAETMGRPLVLCGDLNVARDTIDVHPKERKALGIGQRPEERAAFARLLDHGLVDLGRAADPANEGLFTWWPPWRNMRQRNIGWRIDYALASTNLAARVTSCVVRTAVGTSDHAPVVAELGE